LSQTNPLDPRFFESRRTNNSDSRPGDVRSNYERDRARIIHSAAFRRLQGKTQVMGVGEGDFHRTRLTHSIECAQIGTGLLGIIQHSDHPLEQWLPERDLIEAACFAHDLGHPPFGHGGERALHSKMVDCGGFEGNGQTLRIVSRLEKYRADGGGIDPSRRLVLSILKYPVPYSAFSKHAGHPPKCYFDEEQDIVDWAMEGFVSQDRELLRERSDKGKAKYRTFDCALMELADDIAYGIHDIEDIVARRLIDRDEFGNHVRKAFDAIGGTLLFGENRLSAKTLIGELYAESHRRKQMISLLVNAMVTSCKVHHNAEFQHPLLSFRPSLGNAEAALLGDLQNISYDLVVRKAKLQQLERRGQRIVSELFSALAETPEQLIPSASWEGGERQATLCRRVCDYVAGMTDAYAEKVYQRLFTPGFGSSSDEL
jgi:dGTPase